VAAHYPVLHAALQSREVNWVIVSTDVRYAAPAGLGESVTIESSILRCTRNSALLEVTMRGAQDLKAVMWSWLRCIDLRRGIVVNHSPEIHAFLQEAMLCVNSMSIDERVRTLRGTGEDTQHELVAT